MQTLDDRIRLVLSEEINPILSSHGGRAELVGVEGGTVSIRLAGGCLGCAMAAATLRDGVARILRGRLPGIEEVIDVSDHASGDHPYGAP